MEELLTTEGLKAAYRNVWTQYRRDDEVEITTENHRRLAGLLVELTASFGRSITVLDAGCGTGRYFYCLKNVAHLVGLDISEEMLRAAKNPVAWDRLHINKTQLLCANIHKVAFPAHTFDFIYSLGMFGFGCPLTLQLANLFFDWLKPGGILFFNVVDFSSLPAKERFRKKIRRVLFALFPGYAQRKIARSQGKVQFFGLTKRQLRRLMNASKFAGAYELTSTVCMSPLGKGRHLECVARKQPQNTPVRHL